MIRREGHLEIGHCVETEFEIVTLYIIVVVAGRTAIPNNILPMRTGAFRIERFALTDPAHDLAIFFGGPNDLIDELKNIPQTTNRPFLRTSAKTGENVDLAFKMLATHIYDKAVKSLI